MSPSDLRAHRVYGSLPRAEQRPRESGHHCARGAVDSVSAVHAQVLPQGLQSRQGGILTWNLGKTGLTIRKKNAGRRSSLASHGNARQTTKMSLQEHLEEKLACRVSTAESRCPHHPYGLFNRARDHAHRDRSSPPQLAGTRVLLPAPEGTSPPCFHHGALPVSKYSPSGDQGGEIPWPRRWRGRGSPV